MKTLAMESREGPGGSATAGHKDFVSMLVAEQWFGLPVLAVQDVLAVQRITRIPLAPTEIAGALNLRGRIVTAFEMRSRLGLPPRPADMPGMNVVVDHSGELYSLIVDSVGEVLSLPADSFERTPATLDGRWRGVADGIYRMTDKLLVVLDVTRLLGINRSEAA